MFLNHRPILVLLLFLAASPVDVVSKVLYSESADPDGYPSNRTLSADPLRLDMNPMHLLCPVCGILQSVLGLVTGILGAVLGSGLVEGIQILVLRGILKGFIHLPIAPMLIADVLVELVGMIGKKAGSGICPLLMMCPMPKNKAKPTKSTILSAVDEYEDHIVGIVESRDSVNLSPEMESLYEELYSQIPAEMLKSTGVEEEARHVLRNFVAAAQYHLAHRQEYLAIKSQNL